MDRANDPAAERLTLVIGDRNLSSWSLRPWLAARQAGIPFAEIAVRLGQPDSAESIRRHSPSGKVPCLLVGEGTARWPIWDSLAICEYLAEQNPDLWPTDRAQRAEARSVSAEMHSGFSALRQHLSMNINASRPLPSLPPDVAADVGRIIAIWESCRARHGRQGGFLFGTFSIADAMYAPVVWRFRTYAIDVPSASQDWLQTMLDLPAMREWQAGALAEAG
ncbi:MAG TPA: glutathione S-transferase family protein [Accumulibacter sp.]|nr:glutathione S-transferase family protein [Accumulibacter sp.]HMW17790.1 glutathione S-transferase family protein [Accumulibacter sp.]HMX22293.1 glutathione S-transferase family protein [Accumulibacter sp.]HND80933.1 glutathione S-transferase family protein [Accumulibacter sp.]HNE13733.1 glutathione S-transferase family protein [Accumulibacter sp.]